MRKWGRIRVVTALVFVFMVLGGCGAESEGVELVEDFQFSYTWGTYGISSYDSATGKLVKTTDATRPGDYETTLFLDEITMQEIYELLKELDLESYPDTYDPINAPDAEVIVLSEPSRTLILSVKKGEVTKTITCNDIAYMSEGYDKKSQAFLDACTRLEEILTTTKEWLELPEYEHLYCERIGRYSCLCCRDERRRLLCQTP